MTSCPHGPTGSAWGGGRAVQPPSTQGVCPVWTEALNTPHSRQPPPCAICVLRRVTQVVLTVTCLRHRAHWTDEDAEAQSVFGTCARSRCWEGWSGPRGGCGLPFACHGCGHGARGYCEFLPKDSQAAWAAAGRGPEGSASCVWTGRGCQAEGHVCPGLRSHHLPSLGLGFLLKGNNRTQPQRVFAANPGQQVCGWVCGPVSVEPELL